MNLSALDEHFISNLDADARHDFSRWLEQLEEANADLDSPYGANVVTTCGASHWYIYWDEGFMAKDALIEDLHSGE